MAQAGTARALWPVTTVVSCLPVLVLRAGMLRAVSEDNWPLDQDVELKTFDELRDLLLRRGATHLVYRGQRDYDWPLVCTLSRALRDQALAGGPIEHDLMESMVVDTDFTRYVNDVETKLLRVFMEQAKGLALPDLPPSTDRLAWWELMQHHGAPTRLLDWTRSPFIALWFAFRHHADDDGDAALWVFDTRNSWLNNREALAQADSSGWENFLDDRQWQDRLAEDAIVKNGMVPLVISPRVLVPRVVAQQSVMTLVPNIEAPKYFNHFVLKTVSTKIRLPSSWKSAALVLCENLGITPSAMFRDLDSTGDSLRAALTKNLPFTAPDSAFRDYFNSRKTQQPAIPDSPDVSPGRE